MMFGFVDCAQVGREKTEPARANELAAVVWTNRRREIALCCAMATLAPGCQVIGVNPNILVNFAEAKKSPAKAEPKAVHGHSQGNWQLLLCQAYCYLT